MITRLGSALDDQTDSRAASGYVEIPAKIGFFKKLRLERDGKELPKERIDLPLELTATFRMLCQSVAFWAGGGASLAGFYAFLLSPENVFSPAFSHGNAHIWERILMGCIGAFMFLIGISCLCIGTSRFFNFFRTGPLLVIEKDGFRYVPLSLSLIPWSDIAFYQLMAGKGGVYGMYFFLRNVVPQDRRWRPRRIERYARRKKLGASIIAVPASGLSSSTRVVTDVMHQLAICHGAKPRPT